MRTYCPINKSKFISEGSVTELKGMVRQVGGIKYIVACEPGVTYVVE